MEQINFVVVFLEGILSFLSPCILPILPVYLAILSNSTGENSIDNGASNQRGTLVKNTILFVLGISTTFFILGTGIGALQPFLTANRQIVLILGGIMIMIMGLFYIGDLNIPFLQRERKLHYKVKGMNPLSAYVLGFTFSFGWTPCIGPMLASVLVVASTAQSKLAGNLLIATYTLGFIIPFLILAVFSKRMMKVLDKVKLQRDTLQKIGGYILIITGFIMTFNGIREPRIIRPSEQPTQEYVIKEESKEEEAKPEIVAPDFTLLDQYGKKHTLSDYKGKVVFLNFWATWCPPCRQEMPDIEALYKKYGMNEKDVIVLGVAAPLLGDEGSKEEIIKFLEDAEYTFPVVFDETSQLTYDYYIRAYPTTYIINPEGNIELYVPGAISGETMEEIIKIKE
ncbi:MAG: cytochrome c biogenesis protein/redoxin [Cellulosilyticaceae bacterium]